MRRASPFPPKGLEYLRNFIRDIMTSEACIRLEMLLFLSLLWALVVFLLLWPNMTKSNLMKEEFILVFSLRRDAVWHNKGVQAAGMWGSCVTSHLQWWRGEETRSMSMLWDFKTCPYWLSSSNKDLPPKHFKLSKTELPAKNGGIKHRAIKAISHSDPSNLSLAFKGS